MMDPCQKTLHGHAKTKREVLSKEAPRAQSSRAAARNGRTIRARQRPRYVILYCDPDLAGTCTQRRCVRYIPFPESDVHNNDDSDDSNALSGRTHRVLDPVRPPRGLSLLSGATR